MSSNKHFGMADFAIRDIQDLPKLPVRKQHLRRLSGLVRLNRMVQKASDAIQTEQEYREWVGRESHRKAA